MNIVIAGAGELGQLLAEKLSAYDHDVMMIDSSSDALENTRESLEVSLQEGSCIDLDTLKEAHIQTADVLLAVSGDTAANVLACQIASRLGAKRTICRVKDGKLFSAKELSPDSFGIWKYVSPPEECVRKIAAVLWDPYVLEEIRFSHPDAVMQVFKIGRSSLLANARIKDLSMDPALRDSIRFAAVIREKQFIVPHGDTIFVPGDKVYVAGTSANVRAFIEWAAGDQEESRSSRVVISGFSEIGIRLANTLSAEDYEVRFIEKDSHVAEEKLPDLLPSGVMIIKGDPTSEEILAEAGVADCDAFISANVDDEENILCCVMAKQQGARKTISVTSKSEYITLVPMMDWIDCGVSSSLVAVNSILRMLETGTMRVDAYLQLYHAQLTEFRISNSSPLCGRSLATCKLPVSTLFALMFRDQEVIAPSGGTIFRPGDIVVAIVAKGSQDELAPLFPDR